MLQKAVQYSSHGTPMEKPRRVVLLREGGLCTVVCSLGPCKYATAYIVFNGVHDVYNDRQHDGCCMLTDFELGDPKATRRNNLKRG